ncbi:MAG: cytochrome P450 [Bacteroidota bacterium]
MNKPLLWKPFDPEYVRDPYQMYRILREQDPVHLAQTKEFIITKYDDVKEILKSPSFQSGNRLEWLKRGIQYFENKEEDFKAIYSAMNSFILMLNAPGHTRIRNFVSKAWNDREVDDIIKKNIAKLLAKLPGKQIDIVDDYAQPLPVLTISDILGIPTSDYNYLKDLGITMTKTLDLYVSLKDMVQMNDAARKFIDFFSEQVRLKSDKPDEGLLSKLMRKNKADGFGLTEQEIISISIFLFIAGEETSASLISGTIYHLLRHPYQLDLLRQQPELSASTIEEVLRFDPIVQLLGRIAKEDYKIRSKTIPAGSTVTLVVGSANRDETVFDQADNFVIARQPNRHLAFGTGVHFCLGDWLGRRQGQLGVQSFLQQYPHLTLVDQEISWYKNLAIRSLQSLRVNL